MSDSSYLDANNITDISTAMLTLRKPTELKKVIDSIPKPIRAVPKNGLPLWYRLGLECKLPVPKMPQGKIIFSRGKIGEDVRRLGLGSSGPCPTFDLSDPYCNDVSYDYVAMHDPHLAHHFAQKPARNRMKILGFCTKDNRAVCTLKEFNQYRKYLYNRFMDRIHMEMKRLDERARDDLTLKQVELDVSRRLKLFTRRERARERLEKVAKEHADEWDEKRRAAKQQEMKVQARMRYLAEYNEKKRQDRAARAYEQESRIKKRIQAATEMEVRRKITMMRQWRVSEENRLHRLKEDRTTKLKRIEEESNNKWKARVDAQNQKLQEEAILLKLYTEDMTAAAKRRMKKAEVYAYNTDLDLQRITLTNIKLMHGETMKAAKLVRKMGIEFEKTKRGARGMTKAVAQRLAADAMKTAVSMQGDSLMTLGQARARMDLEIILPPAPIKLLDEILESAIMEFSRRHVDQLLRDLQRMVHSKASVVFFQDIRPTPQKKRSKTPKWCMQVRSELARHCEQKNSIFFGPVARISIEELQSDLKSIRDRPPTPVPSKTKLAEVTFLDRVEDLPDPVTIPSFLPERKKIFEMVNAAAKLLSRTVTQRVLKGIDVTVGKVTLPNMRHTMEWGEAVECLSQAVVNNRVSPESGDVRRVGEFLAHRILRKLLADMKEEKRNQKNRKTEEKKDFYTPGKVSAG